MLEGLLADDMLHPAGVLFRRYRVYSSLDQPVGKETVLFVDMLRHFPAHIGQMQEIVAVHRQETPVPQDGSINRANHAFFFLQHQHSL